MVKSLSFALRYPSVALRRVCRRDNHSTAQSNAAIIENDTKVSRAFVRRSKYFNMACVQTLICRDKIQYNASFDMVIEPVRLTGCNRDRL
jgi:hypothetical protein